MMTLAIPTLQASVSLQIPTNPIMRLSVDQYHAMVQHGILTEDDRVELLEGWLVTKMPKNPPHVTATDLTADKLNDLKPAGWSVRRQDPITTDDSEPEPDVVLARGTRRDFEKRHPGPSDIALLVEVADSTIDLDRTTKKRAYAAAGISLYWIVNLIDRTVEVFSDPSGPSRNPEFRTMSVRRESESLNVIVEGLDLGPIEVRDLLPRS